MAFGRGSGAQARPQTEADIASAAGSDSAPRRDSGERLADIARNYNVSRSAISRLEGVNR